MPEKIVFFLSTSRTGTKSLAEGLMRDDVFSPHQPPFSRLLTIASNYYLHGWFAKYRLEWLVKRLREPQLQKADCKYYMQVFSLDYLPAKIISEKYSNVYIIHIVRDPRTFVPSYLNWVHGRFKSFVANKLVFGWHPSGFFTGEYSWQDWRRMDEFQKVCWHWQYKNSLLEHLFQDYEKYMRVRFEELFSEKGEKTLGDLFAFTGIPLPGGFADMLHTKKNLSLKKSFPPWDQWDPAKRQLLVDICSDGMQRYGYL
jgi:hypothetical protein